MLTGVAALGGLWLGGRLALERAARPAPPDGPLSSEARALWQQVWQGLDPARVLDCHVHVVGLGTGGTGCWINPRMRSLSHPLAYVRFEVYRRAAGIEDLSRADASYAERLAMLARQLEPHGRLLLLAFDYAHHPDGSRDEEASEFHVPNDYVLALAREHPDVFSACASIHPYRPDAVAELERVAQAGARAVKWLPSAMRIDPADPACDPFYRKLSELSLPLLTHAGEERAVEVADAQKLCNPLKLRRALDAGVKVIVCHCASSGDGIDLDVGPDGPLVPNLDLFLRMMDEPRYQGVLYGDISALTQANRCELLGKLLGRADLHPRMINGSDYPLPAIHALVRTGKLESLGFITAAERAALNELDRHNPLAFDFALKRCVRGQLNARFAEATFMPPADLFPASPGQKPL